MKFVWWVAFLFLGMSKAQGQGLPLTDDTWINGNLPDTPLGDGTFIFVHDFGPKSALIKFDTSSIAGSTISAATLGLVLSDARAAGSITVRPITSPWDESSVTWRSAPDTGAPVGTLEIAPVNVGNRVSLDVTSIVQAWADGSTQPEGLLLSSDASIRAFFGTKEGGSPATLEVTGGSSTPTPTGEILDLSSPPVVINEPGNYRIDRDWAPDVPMDSALAVIHVLARDVRLDLGGFRIDGQGSGTIIRFEANNFHLKDGFVRVSEGMPIYGTSTADWALIEDVFAGGSTDGTIDALGANVTLRRVRTSSRVGVFLGPMATLENSNIACSLSCINAGMGAQIRGNLVDKFDFEGPGMAIEDNSIVSDNVVSFYAQDSADPGIAVIGNNSTVTNNILQFGGSAIDLGTGIRVAGTGNVIDGNLLLRSPQGNQATVGIAFQSDGNFYGDNRVDAEVGFDFGGTVQTDLGGNVEYTRNPDGNL